LAALTSSESKEEEGQSRKEDEGNKRKKKTKDQKYWRGNKEEKQNM
jgi:hypothetical protein